MIFLPLFSIVFTAPNVLLCLYKNGSPHTSFIARTRNPTIQGLWQSKSVGFHLFFGVFKFPCAEKSLL